MACCFFFNKGFRNGNSVFDALSFKESGNIIVGAEYAQLFAGVLCGNMGDKIAHCFCGSGHIGIGEISLNKPFIRKVPNLVFKSKNTFKGWPVFSEVVIDMNENFTAVADQEIGCQLTAGKIIIINLFEVSAGSFY